MLMDNLPRHPASCQVCRKCIPKISGYGLQLVIQMLLLYVAPRLSRDLT